MKVLPAAGRERTRALVLVGLLALAGYFYFYREDTPAPVPLTTGPAAAPSPALAAPRPQARAATAPSREAPEPLKLDQLERVPDEPAPGGRNLFRFGVRPAPPPPVTVAPPPAPPPAPPAPPAGPPPIPLRLSILMDDPYGQKRAYLVDQSGAVFEAVEGQVIDGRYRLLKVTANSATVAYLDGTGQRVLSLGGR